MSIQDQVNAATDAVAQAQAALTDAQSRLDAAMASQEASAPHLSVLAEIEAFGGQLIPDVREAFAALIAKARALL